MAPSRAGLCISNIVLFLTSSIIPSLAQSTPPSTQCIPSPIHIPISNITVANGVPNAIARGASIKIGTPPQNIAFLPSWFDNSFVYNDNNLCSIIGSDIDPESCITARGGAYNAIASTTQKQGNQAASPTDPYPYPATSIYADIFALNDNVQLSNYTFGVPLNDWGEQFYMPQAGLGLGSNSTLLGQLKKQNMIASRSWSMFWGRNGRGTQTNGSIVLGGYDKALVQETTNFTRKLNFTNCQWGTAFEVSHLGLINLDGTQSDLYDGATDGNVTLPLEGCIDPAGIGMGSMPFNNYFAHFVTDTGYQDFYTYNSGNQTIRSNGYNYYDLIYFNRAQIYTGDLNVTIADGPTIRILNDQFVTPHIYLDNSTHVWTQDVTLSDLKLQPIGASGDFQPIPISLGRNSLTFLYMMINLDAGEYTIWPALNDATGQTQQLQAVDENNNPVASSCASSTASSSGSRSNPGSATQTGYSSSTKATNTGAIAGGVVGGIAGLALALGGVWFFIRHRIKRNEVPPVYNAVDDSKNNGKMIASPNDGIPGNTTLTPELDDPMSNRRVSEMYAPIPQRTYEVEG